MKREGLVVSRAPMTRPRKRPREGERRREDIPAAMFLAWRWRASLAKAWERSIPRTTTSARTERWMTWREVREEMKVEEPMREEEEGEEEEEREEEIPPVETHPGETRVSTSRVKTLPAYDAHDERGDETE